MERPLTRLPRAGAVALLAMLAAIMVWSATLLVPLETAPQTPSTANEVGTAGDKQKGDLALYRRISERVSSGESYYEVAVEEQRAGNYPVRPFVTVRLPTLAWMQSLIGIEGVRIVAVALLLLSLLYFNARLAKRTVLLERASGLAMIMLGGIAATIPVAGLVHEIMAGLLLTLAFVAYDPKRFWLSLLAAALALAIREISVAFVLLWLVCSLAERRWREAAALGGLIAASAIGMFGHYLAVDAHSLAGDPRSQGWEAFAGYGLPISALVKLTFLSTIPSAMAAMLAVMPLLGWLGLGGRAGLFGLLWFIGHCTALALFARPENFYWIQLILPAYLAGFAFAPRALYEVFVAAFRPARD